MFNIENEISEWRRRMLAAGVKSSTTLDELTEHLRSDVEQQMRTGLDAELAFSRAVERIGAAPKVREEFSKIRPRTGAGFESWFSVGLLTLIVSTLFGSELVFFKLQMGVVQQIVAFVGIGLVLLVCCGWRYALPYLPDVSSSQRKWAIGLSWTTSALLGLLAAFGLPNVITNAIDQSPSEAANNLIVALVWAGVPMAICVCAFLALSMDRKARERWGMVPPEYN